MTGRQPLSIFVTLATVGFYALSFFLPFADGGLRHPQAVTGLDAFKWIVDVNLDVIRGNGRGMEDVRWFGMFLPHPVFWAGAFLLLTRAYRGAAMAGILATMLAALWAFNFETMRFQLDGYQPGFYVWWGSMLMLMFAGLWGGTRDY